MTTPQQHYFFPFFKILLEIRVKKAQAKYTFVRVPDFVHLQKADLIFTSPLGILVAASLEPLRCFRLTCIVFFCFKKCAAYPLSSIFVLFSMSCFTSCSTSPKKPDLRTFLNFLFQTLRNITESATPPEKKKRTLNF